MALTREQRFVQLLSQAMILRGWALAAQGHEVEGLTPMRQGLTAHWNIGAQAGQWAAGSQVPAAHCVYASSARWLHHGLRLFTGVD
jgi:hypothetical protein